MTNKEAIERIQSIKSKVSLYVDVVSLRMAEEALEKQKTGHWIDVTNGRGGHKCDNCHEYAPSYQSGDEYLTKYCPECGAKMQEVEE